MSQNIHRFSYLKSVNSEYIDEVFQRYLQDADSVDESWRYFFEGLELGTEESADLSNGHANGAVATPATTTQASAIDLMSEVRVADLIAAYRERGRLLANLNPLAAPASTHPLLDLSNFGLSSADLNRSFLAGKLIGMGPAPLKEIIQRLRDTYCGTIAAEFNHIQNPEARNWLQGRMESSRNRENLDTNTRKFILRRLTESETFERFLHTRYVAQKRFSIEGGEATIPYLDATIEIGAELGAEEFVVGMAHRGRLNVLVNIFEKKLEYIFTEFEGAYKADLSMGEGDVKYHQGYSADRVTRNGKKVHLSMAANPSHLEFVNPVVTGVARAKQDIRGDKNRAQVIPVLIHGDAAFAGQGVVYETLNFAQLPGYSTGGTIHIVINNQVGFTADPWESRSTTYCTDVAKMLEAPVFHVNGDDPEAVWYVAKLCAEYRQKFKQDVFVDIVCYRKHGHNEGDEPSFTQPLMYKTIKSHPSPREVYAKSLAQAGVVSEAEAQGVVDEITNKMTQAQQKTRAENPSPFTSVFDGKWKGLRRASDEDIIAPVDTAVSEKKIKEIAATINQIPASFHLHSKLARFFDARAKAIQDGQGIDWGNGETLAYATLLTEGHAVRISGQDAGRGTFTHRHAVLHDFETGEILVPLNHIQGKQAQFAVYNSHLSETGVLGFELGYSMADPNSLVVWEAQFGDFSNGAQVIIDQFIASSETKWQRMSGLTLLLPHGYEGQGPEHSSARLERFLQLSGRNNWSVCNLTTPSQIFHALRRQMKRPFRKPLIVMSPKSLLRHPQAISPLSDFTQGRFQEVLDDASIADPKQVQKVILCSGKVYYDLLAERANNPALQKSVALVRVEQLYPFPAGQLEKILGRYSKVKSLLWVQEEPRNMGAWTYVFSHWSGGFDQFPGIQDRMGGKPLRYVGREVSATPAVGSAKVHEKEQKALVARALSSES